MNRLLILPLGVCFLYLAGCGDDDVTGPVDGPGEVELLLTLLHNNDGESQLVNAGAGMEEFGGVARFVTLMNELETQSLELRGGSAAQEAAVITVSSGDNFLAGPEFNLSLQRGIPHFDAVALDFVGYDALAIGNHEFDFGPDILADFIESFDRTQPPFLSANLDFSGEPQLQGLVQAGRIASSVVVPIGEDEIGIVGATTPNLPFISSPRNVMVMGMVAGAVQAEVDRLEGMGVNKIVLISHLQGLAEDLALIPNLSGVDIVVAGGGDELLADAGTILIPGDEEIVMGPYPETAMDADGVSVPVVTTAGGYRYVGRLVVGFDADGEVVEVDPTSGPVRVAEADGILPDPDVQSLVTDPIVAGLAALASNVIGNSEVDLDGRRSEVRSRETNEGNLVADALRWQAERLAASFGVAVPDIALQNGGGIRNDAIVPAGAITELLTFDILPFPNFVTVVEDISRAQVKELLENAVSRAAPDDGGSGTGRFAQVSGLVFEWDPTGTAQELDDMGNVVMPGTRIVNATLDDGTQIVMDGAVVEGDALSVATIDFLARGGDQYPFRDAPFTTLGVTYQQALFNYIVDGLGGTITAADYPVGGEGRIVER